MRRSIFCALLALPMFANAATSAAASDDHVKVSLISEQAAFVPGTTAWLGLRFTHQPHWHTYWINPGDSGLPTKATWHLPDGFVANDIEWPTPTRIAVGELANFGYTGDMILPVEITVPRDAQEGSTAHVGVDVKWLVCREECIPGSASLSLDLPVHSITANNEASEKLFDAARAAAPKIAPWSGSARVNGNSVDVVLHNSTLPTSGPIDAYAIDRKVVSNAPPTVTRHPNDVELVFKKSDYFESAPSQFNVLVRAGEGSAAHTWHVTVPFETSAK